MADDDDLRRGSRCDFGDDAIDCILGVGVEFVRTLYEMHEIRHGLRWQTLFAG